MPTSDEIWQDAMADIMAEARERGVPAWVVARDMRENCEDETDRVIVAELEQLLREKIGDEPGWQSE